MKGIIFDIKEMAVHDGPGIRTTVFLKGCPLRCKWCHNPEGLKSEPQLMYKKTICTDCKKCRKDCNHDICVPFGRCILSCPENCLEIAGRQTDSESLSTELTKSAEVLGKNFGGFTFSGGEPLFQPEFLFETMKRLNDYHLCIETSGYAPSDVFEKMLTLTDFVIMDIKIMDSDLHKKYTGEKNERILENYKILKSSDKPHIIRTPMITGITDTKENLSAIREFITDSTWEQIPENKMAGAKYEMMNMEFDLFQERGLQ